MAKSTTTAKAPDERAPPGKTADGRLFLQSVARAFSVLEAFGHETRPLSLAEIAAAAGIDKSAAQRITSTLQHLGYLERDSVGNGLRPGRRLLDRSFDYLRLDPLIERATPVLIEIRKTANERVDFSLFDDLTIVYAVRQQSKRETFSATLIGRRVPTYCSSGGRAVMAKLPDAEIESIIGRSERRAWTPKTITAPEAVRNKVNEARREGFATAVEELLLGEVTVAAAVSDNIGRPVAAVHIAGSLGEWEVKEFRRRFGPLANEAARALSRGER